MQLDALKVLNIYNYKKERGGKDLIKSFKKDINPVELSTCMRQIYLFQTEKTDSLQELLDDLENAPMQRKGQFDFIEGEKAYAFLLYWLLGGYNKKSPLNDDRLLGQFRDIFNKNKSSNAVKVKKAFVENEKVFNSLLIDSKKMHQVLLDHKDLSLEKKQELFEKACVHCAGKRADGTLQSIPGFDYSHFLLEVDELHKEIIVCIEQAEKKLGRELEKFSLSNNGNAFFKILKTNSLRDLKEKFKYMDLKASI